MVRWILGSFVLSEAVIGFVLTILLLLGKADQASVVDVLSSTGFFVFVFGLLPLLSKIRQSMLYEPQEPQPDDDPTLKQPSSSGFRAFAKLHANLFRVLLVGGIVFGNALGLFYLTGSF
ncbi:hypothetical protein IH601_10920 [Candidatus Bipolaricaulota bacterium]|nr:hypothetical protein [Candidatus Bipolaricaulota bacterium]TFH11065.1 MAG: hypothetical protein E4H08_02200 [Candidatus Atribacteria bacterium]